MLLCSFGVHLIGSRGLVEKRSSEAGKKAIIARNLTDLLFLLFANFAVEPYFSRSRVVPNDSFQVFEDFQTILGARKGSLFPAGSPIPQPQPLYLGLAHRSSQQLESSILVIHHQPRFSLATPKAFAIPSLTSLTISPAPLTSLTSPIPVPA